MTSKYICSFSAAAAFLLTPLAGFAAEKSGGAGSLSSPDDKFVPKAAEGGMAEVKLGELAAKKGASQEVKQFGSKMVTDHGKANSELKGVAEKKGVSLPAKLDAKHEAAYERLSKLEGEAFDKAYIADMVQDHRTDVKEFEQEAKGGKDPDVKGFAEKTLPVIKSHLEMATSMEGKMGKAK